MTVWPKSNESDPATILSSISTILNFHTDVSLANKAETVANQMIAANPEFAPALVALGLASETKQDYVAARQKYEKALKAYPGTVPAQRQLAILLAEKLADDQAAFELATAVRSLTPEDAEVSKVLGKIHYRRGDHKEAIRLLKESLSRRSTEDADLLYHLGMAQFHVQDKQAKQSLTRALTLDKNQKLASEAEKALAELK